MEKKKKLELDWVLLILYLVLVAFGWINLYAVTYEIDGPMNSLLTFSTSSGKQLIWILGAFMLFAISLLFDTQFYTSMAYVLYAISLLVLAGTLIWGVKVGGHSAWFQWHFIQIQPGEFVKLTCALALAKRLERITDKLTCLHTQIASFMIILLPFFLILLQGDVGSGIVFGTFIVVLYREGFPALFILIGMGILAIFILGLLVPSTYLVVATLSIGLVFVVIGKRTIQRMVAIGIVMVSAIILIEGFDWIIKNVLKPHQQNRLKVLVTPDADPLGIGWNVTQSKIAIGSGRIWGKGFLKGTQTKYGFVPEQRKDFIFCTIGEEYGWVGSCIFIAVFTALVLRIIYLAERQRLRFARAYGYGVSAVLFFHFFINVGMTIGLLPVIGIPLPFISYGGSSLWAFSAMLFILIKLDAERNNYISWKHMALEIE